MGSSIYNCILKNDWFRSMTFHCNQKIWFLISNFLKRGQIIVVPSLDLNSKLRLQTRKSSKIFTKLKFKKLIWVDKSKPNIYIPLPFVWLTPIKLLIIIIVITVMGLLITIGLITISLITVILVVILVVTLVIVILGKTWLVVIAARWWLAVNKNENFGNLYSSYF